LLAQEVFLQRGTSTISQWKVSQNRVTLENILCVGIIEDIQGELKNFCHYVHAIKYKLVVIIIFLLWC